MSIESIGAVPAIMSLDRPETNNIISKPGADFSSWLNQQIAEVNDQIQVADRQVNRLAAGQADNLHDVMLSLEKAKMSFELMLQVRNKVLEGYQEIMRMQI